MIMKRTLEHTAMIRRREHYIGRLISSAILYVPFFSSSSGVVKIGFLSYHDCLN